MSTTQIQKDRAVLRASILKMIRERGDSQLLEAKDSCVQGVAALAALDQADAAEQSATALTDIATNIEALLNAIERR